MSSSQNELTTQVTADAGFQLVCVKGSVCDSDAEQLRNTLEEAAQNETGKLVIDLSEVDYISSSGIGVLVSTLKKARHSGGSLVLCGMTPDIHELFTLTHLDRVFTIAATVDSYRESCS